MLRTLCTALIVSLSLLNFSSLVSANDHTNEQTQAHQTPKTQSSEPKIIRIGVLALDGKEEALKNFSSTRDWLSQQLPQYQFKLVPLNFSDTQNAIEMQTVDLLLANPAQFVLFRKSHDLTALLTLKRDFENGLEANLMGSVIFTRGNLFALTHAHEIRHAKLAAVNEKSAGGYLFAIHEYPELTENDIAFYNTHHATVFAVLSGEKDYGIVRTGIIEKLILSKQIESTDLRVINAQKKKALNCNQCSNALYISSTTKLYPEWPLISLPHLGLDIQTQIATTLLKAPPLASMLANLKFSWTPPANYQALEHLLLKPTQQAELWPNLLTHSLNLAMLFVIAILAWYVIRQKHLLKGAKLAPTSFNNLENKLFYQFSEAHHPSDLTTLKNLIEALPVAVFLLNQEKKISFSNQRFERLVDLSQKQLRGQPLSSLIAPSDYEMLLQKLNCWNTQALSYESINLEEVRLQIADRTISQQMILNCFQLEKTRFALISLVHKETSQKLPPQAHELPKEMRYFLELTPVMFFHLAKDLHIIQMNQPGEKPFNFDFNATSTLFTKLIEPNDRNYIEMELTEFILSEERKTHL